MRWKFSEIYGGPISVFLRNSSIDGWTVVTVAYWGGLLIRCAARGAVCKARLSSIALEHLRFFRQVSQALHQPTRVD
jgi:hypothetical protein